MTNVVKKQHGFTLLELVVVVAVLGLITSLATEFVVNDANQARYDLTKERRDNYRIALSAYYDDCGNYPVHLDWLVDKSKLGTNACGTSNDDWDGPYILDVDFENGVPTYRDGWGNASTALASDYGWKYTPYSTSAALATYGLDGVAGTTSASGATEAVFEQDEGDGFTLVSAPSSGNYYLISVASGAVNILSCREGSASTAADSVSMSRCM